MTLRRRKARAISYCCDGKTLRLSLKLSRFTLSLDGDHPVGDVGTRVFPLVYPRQGVVDGA